MTAVRELVVALVAGGMDAVDAAALVARAGAELAVPQKSSAALRQQRYRDRNKASRSVTQEGDAGRHEVALQTVTNRNDVTDRYDAGNKPLLLKEEKKEDNSEESKRRKPRKRNVPLPDFWLPPARALELAAELGLAIAPIEARFRDYLKSTGRLYADYDAGFCNFVRNTPKFNGNGNGKPPDGYRPNPSAGRATAREADFVAAMGRGALGQLEKGHAAGREREAPGDAGSSSSSDPDERTEDRDRPAFRVVG